MPRLRMRALLLAAIMSTVTLSPAWAASTPASVAKPKPPAAAPAPPRNYTLGPGDTVLVHFSGPNTNLDYDLTINAQGSIFIPRLGVIPAEGQTPAGLQARIQGMINRQAPGHKAQVMLGQSRTLNVFVYGQVRQPGAIPFRQGARLSEYLNLAGGPTPQAWLQSVKVTKAAAGQSSTTFEANVDDILFKGRYDLDPVLGPNDVINVPEAFISLQNFKDVTAIILGGAGLVSLLANVFR